MTTKAEGLALVLISEGINFPMERATRMIKRLRDNGFEVTAVSKPNVDEAEIHRMIQDEL